MGMISDVFRRGLNKMHHIDLTSFYTPVTVLVFFFKIFKQKVFQTAEYSPNLSLIKISNPVCSDFNDRGFKREFH